MEVHMTKVVDVSWIEENVYMVTYNGVVYCVETNTNNTESPISIHVNGSLRGIELRTDEGLYACDIDYSGQYKLEQVEDSNGNPLSI
jgi:hypothetical protein